MNFFKGRLSHKDWKNVDEIPWMFQFFHKGQFTYLLMFFSNFECRKHRISLLHHLFKIDFFEAVMLSDRLWIFQKITYDNVMQEIISSIH